jgi:hypothetical protein
VFLEEWWSQLEEQQPHLAEGLLSGLADVVQIRDGRLGTAAGKGASSRLSIEGNAVEGLGNGVM